MAPGAPVSRAEFLFGRHPWRRMASQVAAPPRQPCPEFCGLSANVAGQVCSWSSTSRIAAAPRQREASDVEMLPRRHSIVDRASWPSCLGHGVRSWWRRGCLLVEPDSLAADILGGEWPRRWRHPLGQHAQLSVASVRTSPARPSAAVRAPRQRASCRMRHRSSSPVADGQRPRPAQS